MAEIKLIDIGTTADDGTGDTLRAAFNICNNNAYVLRYLQGPCVGTEYLDVRMAVKNFAVLNDQYFPTANYYISSIVAGVSETGQYRYTIEVSRSLTFTVAGTVVMCYTTLSATPKTAVENVYLAEYNTSKIWGKILIDWALLTLGTTYTMNLPGKGFLFVLNPINPMVSPPGGGGVSPSVHSSAFTATGSESLYLVTAAVDPVIDLWTNCVGSIRIKNSHVAAITIYTTGAADTIDGYGGVSIITNPAIVIDPGVIIEISPTSTANTFIVTSGSYTPYSI